MFTRRQESPVAAQFDALLDEVIEEFEESVERHRQRLAELRDAIGDREGRR